MDKLDVRVPLFLSIIKNFLYSGRTFLKGEEDLKYKFMFVNNIAVLTILITFLLGFMRYDQNNVVMAIVDFSFSAFGVLLLYLLRKRPDMIEGISSSLLFLGYILFTALFVFSDHNTRLETFFLLIASAFFIKGVRIGFYWLLTVMATVSIIHFGGVVETNYSNFSIFSFFIYLIVILSIFNLYEKIKIAQSQNLLNLNIDLENLVKQRTEELEITNNELTKEKLVLQGLSSKDSLTGLFNRFKLEEAFEYEQKQSNRYETDLSIIMIDIDDFKSVNDTYGHNIGDVFLKEIAEILKTSFRDVDTVGRWGGEEFLILLPKTNLEDSREIAEKVRKEIELHKFTEIGNKTASFGVAAHSNNESLSSLLNRADKALYAAKENGRNRVEVAIHTS
jgi:diguanylate cyclase (GGDEF)-like protein